MKSRPIRFLLPSDPKQAVEWLRAKLPPIWRENEIDLLELCTLRGSEAYPLGYWHTPLLVDTSGIQEVDPEVYGDMSAAYMLGCSYYFLLDSICDGHCAENLSPVYLTHLLCGATFLYQRSFRGASDDAKQAVIPLVLENIAKNAQAAKQEVRLRQSLSNSYEDKESDIGRSNIFVLQYRLICLRESVNCNMKVIELLEEYLHLRQRLDDLADWREDYRRGQWTPLLRRCFASTGCVLAEAELEEHVFFSGIYENEIEECLVTLRRLLDLTGALGCNASFMVRELEHVKQKATIALSKWVSAKSDFFG